MKHPAFLLCLITISLSRPESECGFFRNLVRFIADLHCLPESKFLSKKHMFLYPNCKKDKKRLKFLMFSADM